MPNAIDFYQLFICELDYLASEPVAVDVLIEKIQLHKSQIIEWLQRAEESGDVKKINRPDVIK